VFYAGVVFGEEEFVEGHGAVDEGYGYVAHCFGCWNVCVGMSVC
jgi:hypothetical protein